ncbi:M61 family peptidase [Brevundimonas sp.]|uniref:M61 family metallopeptidase n=1 Tax=Brevundimonas sp. TaxID=1871086 RepID=UPI002ED7DBFE
MKFVAASLAVLSLGLATPVLAQTPPPVRYELSFENSAHHEAQVRVTYSDLAGGPVRFEMSRSSPGRYAIHEFAKNLYSLTAVDGAGRPLTVERTDPYGWTVSGHDGTVTVTYTLFGDRADGTYAQIDATHAHLNMPATLLWAVGYDERPVTLTFRPYDPDWAVATQLQATGEEFVFSAPNLQYLMDSPVEISDFMMRSWDVTDGDETRTIRLAIHHPETEVEGELFVEKAKAVVDQLIAVFGDVPDFDYGTYTFIADYLPQVSGDGMEHRNSTILSGSRSLSEANYSQIGTLSHEFFHSWNVERIRPRELEPFDFTRANPTPSLWFAEGFTNYYGPLAVRRAGVSNIDAFLANVGGQFNAVLNSPARGYGSPQEMSLRAPFVDAATSIDPNNPNIFVSYYTWGAALALSLDLTLRDRFQNVTLDDYMRWMWRNHGVNEVPYTPDDLRKGLAAVTGDQAFADAFFALSVQGSELPDLQPMLAQAGILMRPRNPTAAWAGPVRLQVNGETVRLATATVPGTGLYLAGLESGDEIVALGDTTIDSQAGWDDALKALKPGDTVAVRFNQRGAERTGQLTLGNDPNVELVRIETTGVQPTAEQLAFRTAWLGAETVQP